MAQLKEHAYLDTPREVAGCAQYADGSVVRLPVVYLQTIVFPGDTVPIRLALSVQALQFWNKYLTTEQGAMLGVISLRGEHQLCEVGCILDPRLRSETLHASASEIHVVTVARQRCRISEYHAGTVVAHATGRVIDGEAVKPISLLSSHSAHVHRYFWRIHTPAWLCDRLWDAAVSSGILLSHYVSGEKSAKAWRAVAIDESSFSFLIARNLPVDHAARQYLLVEDNVSARLRACLGYIRALADRLACTSCGGIIVESVSASRLPLPLNEEAMPIFSNPASINFRVTLLAQVNRDMTVILHRHGPPELADTWYEGYAWSLLSCRTCNAHLGWRYDWLGSRSVVRGAGILRIRWDASADSGKGDWVARVLRSCPLSSDSSAEPVLGLADVVAGVSTLLGLSPPPARRGQGAAFEEPTFESIPLRSAMQSHPPPAGQPWVFYGLHSGAVAAPSFRRGFSPDTDEGPESEPRGF